MKRSFILISICLLLFMLSCILLAGVPHVLRENEIIDSTRLNENFNYLSDGLTSKSIDISNDIKKLNAEISNNKESINSIVHESEEFSDVYSNGKFIGKGFLYKGFLNLIFNNDFKMSELQVNGRFVNQDIFYDQLNCQGKPYIRTRIHSSNQFLFFIGASKGKVFDINGELWYYKPYTPIISITEKSVKKNYYDTVSKLWKVSCSGLSANQYKKHFIEISPNDPSITGIQNEDYPFKNIKIGDYPVLFNQ